MAAEQDPKTAGLAAALQDVTTKAQVVVREEIELAKAEVTTKITSLAKGAAVGIAAGVFVVTALLFFLHGLAWFAWQLLSSETDNIWIGFLVVFLLLMLLGAVAGFLAYRFVVKGTPPTPQLAIEEAQRIKATVQSPPGPPQT